VIPVEVDVNALCNPGNSGETENFGNQDDLGFVIVQSFLLFGNCFGLEKIDNFNF
jgi:hypothetical protein